MEKEVLLSKALVNELAELQVLCMKIYATYFANHWEGPGLELYLKEQFGADRLNKDLKDKTIDYYFVKYGDETVGFLKINKEAEFGGFEKETTCELEKMYVDPDYKGMGIGKIALQKVMDILLQQKKQIFFLGVLDRNENAILFYEKLGFKFHSKIRLEYYYFKEELKGLNLMYLDLNSEIV